MIVPLTQPPRSLASILEGFVPPAADLSVSVRGVETDSRRVRDGSLFLACSGFESHGLSYLDDALKHGAAAVLWEPEPGVEAPDIGVPVWPVEQLRRHAGEIAARYYDHPSRELFCVGITGTDGKTSTAYLLAHALTRLGDAAGYLGTLGYGPVDALELASHTTPDAVRIQRWMRRLVDDRSRAMVMETSSHALDQGRVAGVEFDVGILTNVGRDHLDYHGDLQRYAAAKRLLFDVPSLQLGVLNRDDDLGASWAEDLRSKLPVCVYGIEGESPRSGPFALARDVRLTTRGLRFRLQTPAGSREVESGLLGRFNIYNLLAVAAVLEHRGVSLDDIVGVLPKLGTVPGRMEGFTAPNRPLAVVDYAHTPQALAHALDSLRPHCDGRLICVFGCGGDRDTGKRALMGSAAARLADAVVVTDDNPRSESPFDIVQSILEGMGERRHVRVEHDRERAIRSAIDEARAGDIVLIAGKGHETEQIIGTERRPFSDRGMVSQILHGDSGLEAARGHA
ncbi:UDP-N-acetylmuramoyl-L-alanyl-D-glutamate--2,6-diaminopimelate ligase [uncultured Abyssibacter sp.]|uniref:UDP-N-acetylmuramoyl-L-alanyl-D-glutamate--2, 6-diaminopimelate ligase n=1 Tax=uncultured Abyssibacter sp. TaxID=2320202 RepID=UPI0032B30D34